MKKRTKDAAKKLLQTKLEKVRELTDAEIKTVDGGQAAVTGCTIYTAPA